MVADALFAIYVRSQERGNRDHARRLDYGGSAARDLQFRASIRPEGRHTSRALRVHHFFGQRSRRRLASSRRGDSDRQALPDLFPHVTLAVEPGGIDLLDLQHRPQRRHPTLRRCRGASRSRGAPIDDPDGFDPASARASLRTDFQYSVGRSSSGAKAGAAAAFAPTAVAIFISHDAKSLRRIVFRCRLNDGNVGRARCHTTCYTVVLHRHFRRVLKRLILKDFCAVPCRWRRECPPGNGRNARFIGL